MQAVRRHADTQTERLTRSPIKGVRKLTAAAMIQSAFTAPHVTEFLTIDVTPTVELLDSLKHHRAFSGAKIGILAVVAKALCIAVARNPSVNTRWDEAAGRSSSTTTSIWVSPRQLPEDFWSRTSRTPTP
jgi:pyruvate dehydrogenase E2 component (dihydrolipoamide acetyltransferase)